MMFFCYLEDVGEVITFTVMDGGRSFIFHLYTSLRANLGIYFVAVEMPHPIHVRQNLCLDFSPSLGS